MFISGTTGLDRNYESTASILDQTRKKNISSENLFKKKKRGKKQAHQSLLSQKKNSIEREPE